MTRDSENNTHGSNAERHLFLDEEAPRQPFAQVLGALARLRQSTQQLELDLRLEWVEVGHEARVKGGELHTTGRSAWAKGEAERARVLTVVESSVATERSSTSNVRSSELRYGAEVGSTEMRAHTTTSATTSSLLSRQGLHVWDQQLLNASVTLTPTHLVPANPCTTLINLTTPARCSSLSIGRPSLSCSCSCSRALPLPFESAGTGVFSLSSARLPPNFSSSTYTSSAPTRGRVEPVREACTVTRSSRALARLARLVEVVGWQTGSAGASRLARSNEAGSQVSLTERQQTFGDVSALLGRAETVDVGEEVKRARELLAILATSCESA